MRRLLLVALVLAGCASSRDREPLVDREARAVAAMEALDARMDAIRGLPPAEREARNATLGDEIDRAAKASEGTRLENKAFYLQAQWRFNYAGGAGCAAALDRLDHAGSPALKVMGQALRVNLDLREGRIDAATAAAKALAVEYPFLAPLNDLVAFYGLVGKPAPAASGQPLLDSPADPWRRPEPWLVVALVPEADAESLFQVQRLLDEAARPEWHGTLRVVAMVVAGSALQAVRPLGGMEHRERLDAWWVPPDATAAWRTAWRVPGYANALLGAAAKDGTRAVVAVQVAPADLRTLAGLR